LISSDIENKIPDELKQEKIWTFTRTDFDEKTQSDLKVPMDPVALDLGIYQGIADTSHLLTFETLKQVRNVPDNWLPAFYLTARKNQWAMIDIEPGGVTDKNPYLKIQYDYVEASRHDGLHGLIQLDTSFDFTKKTAVKMPRFDTEVLLNHHFVTLTGKQPTALYQPTISDVKLICEGIQQFATQAKKSEKNIQVDVSLTDVQEPLSQAAQYIYDSLDITQAEPPKGADMSQWEFSQLVSQYGWLQKNRYALIKNLPTDDRTALLYKIAIDRLPYRQKFERKFHDSSHGDTVTYLFYVVRKIIETS
jgi:hypothetical protein